MRSGLVTRTVSFSDFISYYVAFKWSPEGIERPPSKPARPRLAIYSTPAQAQIPTKPQNRSH